MFLLKLLFRFISSIRIIILIAIPIIPDHNPKIKYNILMFLWLVENSHVLIMCNINFEN